MSIRECILSVGGVSEIDLLQIRTFGNCLYADPEICEDGSVTLNAAHEAAEQVHDLIERHFPAVNIL